MKISVLGIYIPIHASLAPSEPLSGGERHFVEVFKRSNSHDIELHLVTTSLGATILTNEGLTMKILHLVHLPFERILHGSIVQLSLLSLLYTVRAIVLVLSLRHKFNIICTSSHFLYEVLPAIIANIRSKAKLVVYLHHTEPTPLIRAKYHYLLPSVLAWISQSFSFTLIRRCTSLIFAFPFTARQLVKRGIPRDKIRIMLNGVDIKEIDSIIQTKVKYDACFLGRLSPLKGIFDLISIWKRVCQNILNARLAIIGGERVEYISQVRNLIKSNNLTRNILLLGTLQKEEKYSVLKACKIFVFPSYEEGFGIAVLEAMACGLPVIVYNLPAYEVFGSDSVIKVPVGDKRAFSETVLRLLLNEKLRTEMSEKAAETASQFDWDKIADNEFKILTQI